jgi:hypothetical protein
MQAVGGVKGTNGYTWDQIYVLVNLTFALGTPAQQATWADTELGQYSLLPFERGLPGYTVNAKDGIRQGDEMQTPLQFIYQAADCRIWHTAEMTVDVTALWEKVADVAWGGAKCVEGAVGWGKRGPEGRGEERGGYRGVGGWYGCLDGFERGAGGGRCVYDAMRRTYNKISRPALTEK